MVRLPGSIEVIALANAVYLGGPDPLAIRARGEISDRLFL